MKLYDDAKEISNWFVTDLKVFINEADGIRSLKIKPSHMAELVKLVNQSTISRNTAKQILQQIVKSGEMPSVVMNNLKATKISNEEALIQIVDDVFAKETIAVRDALKNEKAINFLLGKVIQSTRGRADPKLAIELIRKKIASIST